MGAALRVFERRKIFTPMMKYANRRWWRMNMLGNFLNLALLIFLGI